MSYDHKTQKRTHIIALSSARINLPHLFPTHPSAFAYWCIDRCTDIKVSEFIISDLDYVSRALVASHYALTGLSKRNHALAKTSALQSDLNMRALQCATSKVSCELKTPLNAVRIVLCHPTSLEFNGDA
jgi:hypothetical protein